MKTIILANAKALTALVATLLLLVVHRTGLGLDDATVLELGSLVVGLLVWLVPNTPSSSSTAGGGGKSPEDAAKKTTVARETSLLRRAALALAVVVVAGAVPTTLTGCKLLHDAVPAIDKVLVYVQDAEEILAGVETVATLFFASHPDLATAQADFAKADQKVHQALDALVRLAHAGKDIDDQDVAAAVKDFQEAYRALTYLLQVHGVSVPSPGTGTLGAHVATEPLLMGVHTETR